jgi:hypothetical protein
MNNTFVAGSETEKMRITSEGNVGIGTDSPQQKLQVDGNIYLGPNDSNRAIHSGANIALMADGEVKLVADANDTSGVGASDIVFGYGTSTNTDTNRDFTIAELGTHPRVEIMRIDASTDSVGIGTASPAASLEIESQGNNRTLKLEAVDSGASPSYTVSMLMEGYEGRGNGIFHTDEDFAGEWFVGNPYTANNVSWQVGYDASGGQAEYKAQAKLYIDGTNSRVGIGTSGPEKTLHVEGTARINGDIIAGPVNNNSKAFIKSRNGYSSATTPDYTWYFNDQCGIFHPAGNVIGFSASGERARITTNGFKVTSGALGVNIDPSTTDGRIDATNDIVAYSTSDKRLKENIKPLENSLNKVMKISGVEFDWKPLTEEEKKTIHGNKGHDIGVIAQEIEEVLPEIVTTRDTGYKAVKYEKIVPLLIESIKELKTIVEEQQKEINELKNKS